MTPAFSGRRFFQTLASETVRFLCQAHISARIHASCPARTQEHPCQSPGEPSWGISISLSASQLLALPLRTQNVLSAAVPRYSFLCVPPLLPPPPQPPSSFAVMPPSRDQGDGGAMRTCFYTGCLGLTCKAMQIKCDLTSICGVTRCARAPTSARSSRPCEYLPPTASALIVTSDMTWLIPICSYSNMDPTKTRRGALDHRFLLHTISTGHGKTRWGSIHFHTMKFICPFPVPSVQFSKSLISLMAGHRGTQRKASKTQRGYMEAPGQGWRGAERGPSSCSVE